MEERLANEILDAANNTGGAVKRKRRYAQDGRGKQSVCTLSFLRAGHCLRLLARQVRGIFFGNYPEE